MDLDQIIEMYINEIWDKYDNDNSGMLDKDETKRFIEGMLDEVDDPSDFTAEEFENCFLEFDKNKDGTITKLEMKDFIKTVCGL